MIVADKKVLKANLLKGSVAVQYKLIKLYVVNLGTLGTNAALVSVMTLIGLIETIYPVNGEIPDDVFSYIYYILCLLAWIYSLLAYSEAAISVIWGPVTALSGGKSEEVMIAIKRMKLQQHDAFRLGSLSGFFLLLGMMVFTFALQGYAVGSVCALVYIVGFYMIYWEGRKVMREFDVDRLYSENEDIEEKELDEKVSEITNQISSTIGFNSTTDTTQDDKRERHYEKIIAAKEEELIKIRGRGIIWMKPENTNCFKQIYLVAQKGGLEFYESEEQFLEGTDMKNDYRIELKQYNIETNIRKINDQRNEKYSATSSIRGLVMGSSELSYMDSMSADFDTVNAIKNCKFSLIPKHLTEMEKVDVIHFMAEDSANYGEWVKTLKRMNKISDEIDVLSQVLEHTRGGAVTRAVKKATEMSEVSSSY